jgi:hypothetical protein
VVEYVFLADFNILQDTCIEVQLKLWTRPAYQLAMDCYFKILCACEEIKHLNVEICQVITWICNESRFLHKMEGGYSVQWKGKVRGREGNRRVYGGSGMVVLTVAWVLLLKRFHKLAGMPGFMGLQWSVVSCRSDCGSYA